MTSKDSEESKTLTQRCLVLIFKEKKQRKLDSSLDSKDKADKDTAPLPTGKELYDGLIEVNKDCFWNPHLEESVRNLKYVGFLQPYTLLVSGRDIYLDTVRNAWGRRSLRPPVKFSLYKVGEIKELSMVVCSQNQFTPLPEALCLIIHELTKAKTPANLESIEEKLQDVYRGMQQPSEQIIYEALDSLLKERKVYHNGIGYGIVSPDMFHQPINGCVTVHDNHLVIAGGSHPADPHGNLPTIYIPLPTATPSPSEMRSISCQTEEKTQEEEENNEKKDKENNAKSKGSKKLERSLSMRESKKNKDKKENNFSRSHSMRFSDEKGKNIVKDINLKTSDAHADKDKGDKQSLLSKLFGRSKSTKRTLSTSEDGTSPPPKPEEEKEYATFSAQFPPPDWRQYEQQVKDAIMTTHVSRSATWQHGKAPAFPLDTSGGDPLEELECPLHKSKTLPPHFQGFLEDSMQCTMQRQRSTSSTSSRSSSYQEIPGSPSKKHELLESSVKPRSKATRKHSRRKSSDRHSRLITHQEDPDVRPKSIKPKPQYENTNEPHDDTYLDLNEAIEPKEVEGAETNAIDHPFGSKHRHRPSHKSRIFKKYREMHCTNFANDMTSEYIGKLPKKDIGYSMSRDSGVNCVGLNPTESAPNCVQNNDTNAAPLNNLQATSPLNNMNNTKFIQTTFHNDSANTVTVHKAQIHSIPETSQEDSGFNSPRNENADSLLSTPQAQNDVKHRVWQNNVEISVSMRKENCQGKFMKSIDNLHAEKDASKENELVNSGSWSVSSRQTVKESQPVPYLPPPREWPLPRPVSDRNGNVQLEESEMPREGSPTVEEPIKKEFLDNSKQDPVTLREKNELRSDLNSKEVYRHSSYVKDAVMNGDAKPKTREKRSDLYQAHRQSYHSMDNGAKKNSSSKTKASRSEKDKVKRNLGEELENVKEGSRLHHRAFREYHNNNHHSKTSLNGTAPVRQGDYEVVGIV